MKSKGEVPHEKLLQIEKLVSEALCILSALGVPLLNLTERRKERMAKAFLAVAAVRPGVGWDSLKSNQDGHRFVSREIIRYMNEYLGEHIADSSYDDIRRKDLLLPVEAGIVLKSAAKPNANTNDGTRRYALNPAYAQQVRYFGSPAWDNNLSLFLGNNRTLAHELQRERDMARIPVMIKEDKEIFFSPGPHNQLQKRIIEEFLPIYGYGAEVLYVGDSADKYLYLDEARLRDLSFFEIAHDKLPDVIAYSALKNWLYLIEAVHTANPINEIRRLTLLRLTGQCTASIIFVTAFTNRDLFRKYSKDIAWETEVWIAESPEHLIHFNGDKFLGPYLGT